MNKARTEDANITISLICFVKIYSRLRWEMSVRLPHMLRPRDTVSELCINRVYQFDVDTFVACNRQNS
jgi:hypothetical protein